MEEFDLTKRVIKNSRKTKPQQINSQTLCNKSDLALDPRDRAKVLLEHLFEMVIHILLTIHRLRHVEMTTKSVLIIKTTEDFLHTETQEIIE